MSDEATPATPLATTTQPPSAGALMKISDRGYVPSNRAELWDLACWLIKGNMVPKGFDSPDKICGAMITGMELGLTPAASLRVIAVVNGTPSVWGKGGYALSMTHAMYDHHEVSWVHADGQEYEFPPEYETMEEIPGLIACRCRAWRKGDNLPKRQKFSVNDAKLAKLWNKKASSGADMPWSTYWWTMLYHKAVGNALEEAVPEAYYGLVCAPPEELEAFNPEVNLPNMPTAPMTFKRDDDYYVDVAHTPVETKPAEPKPNSKKVTTTTVPAATKEPEKPKPPPEPDPAFATEQPPAEQPKKAAKPNVNKFMKEFASIHKHHKAARATSDGGKDYVRCDCGAKYEVVHGAATGFTRIEAGDGSCDPKPVPLKEDVNLQPPAQPKGFSSAGVAFEQDIAEETKYSLGDLWTTILGRAKKAKTDSEGEEAGYLIEICIRRMVELDPSSTGITKANAWTNDGKGYMEPDRLEILRAWIRSQTK